MFVVHLLLVVVDFVVVAGMVVEEVYVLVMLDSALREDDQVVAADVNEAFFCSVALIMTDAYIEQRIKS
jgi:hypothetical protein